MKKALKIGGWVATLTLLALSALPCPATDSAVLRNGFSIRHERRQVIGAITRLYINADNSSFVDVPTAEIDHFEVLPDDPGLRPGLQTPAANVGHPPDLDELVRAASRTYSLNPDLVSSVIRAESGFNVRALSPKGAQGLMQLMPQTASELGVRNAFDPQANVEAGTRYLRGLLEHYHFDLIKALAAYNAGPQRVERYGGVPPFYETKAYVARVLRDFNQKTLAAKRVTRRTARSALETKSSGTHVSATRLRKSKPQAQAKVISAPSE